MGLIGSIARIFRRQAKYVYPVPKGKVGDDLVTLPQWAACRFHVTAIVPWPGSWAYVGYWLDNDLLRGCLWQENQIDWPEATRP